MLFLYLDFHPQSLLLSLFPFLTETVIYVFITLDWGLFNKKYEVVRRERRLRFLQYNLFEDSHAHKKIKEVGLFLNA